MWPCAQPPRAAKQWLVTTFLSRIPFQLTCYKTLVAWQENTFEVCPEAGCHPQGSYQGMALEVFIHEKWIQEVHRTPRRSDLKMKDLKSLFVFSERRGQASLQCYSSVSTQQLPSCPEWATQHPCSLRTPISVCFGYAKNWLLWNLIDEQEFGFRAKKGTRQPFSIYCAEEDGCTVQMPG